MGKDGELHREAESKHYVREFMSAVGNLFLPYCTDLSRKKSEDFGRAPKHSKSVVASASID